MSRLYSARQVLRALQAKGFKIARQKGSHIKLKKSVTEGTLTVIVPNHREIASGTLDSILEQAMLSKEEFEELVR